MSHFNDEIIDDTVPPIDDIGVSQFYLDNENPEKQAKFDVRFFGLVGEKNTNAISKIILEGPKGYEFQFKSQPYSNKNGNGYVVDNYNRDMVYYRAFDRNGFLDDGEYNITVEYWNGESRSKLRVLKTNDNLLKSYLKMKSNIIFSTEEKPKYMGDPRIYVNVKWTPLKQLGEIDAYYAPYVSKGRTDFMNLHDLTHFDNIFLTSVLIPSYGLNKSSTLVNTRWRPLEPNSEYSWLTEICDSNSYKDINMTIHQPIQHFKTD